MRTPRRVPDLTRVGPDLGGLDPLAVGDELPFVTEDEARFRSAIARIDERNRPDPNTITIDGAAHPKEQLHAVLACAWVAHLDGNAAEEQYLAARAHHVRRWVLPRGSFPDGRGGYLRWRAAQKKQHAADVAAVLDPLGYSPATIARVQQIVRKEGLGRDPAVQTHEDALCLVFIQTQLLDVAERLDDALVVDVLVKSARKMSTAGVAAIGELDLDPAARAIVGRAVAKL